MQCVVQYSKCSVQCVCVCVQYASGARERERETQSSEEWGGKEEGECFGGESICATLWVSTGWWRRCDGRWKR